MGSQKENRLVKKGILEQQIEKCNKLEAEIKNREQDRINLLNEKAIYDELAMAFGKNGVQALMMESAIPQLEAEANELLGRLTSRLLASRKLCS